MALGALALLTAASLLATAALAVIFAHITGTATEEATLVRSLGDVGRVSLEGLVPAGIMIGALGVLNDVTDTGTAGPPPRRSKAGWIPRRRS